MDKGVVAIVVMVVISYLLRVINGIHQTKIIRENNNMLRALLKKQGVEEKELCGILKGYE